jgi:uncharacterized damage-inducible protein DinB
MKFDLQQIILGLRSTPETLRVLLSNLPESWTHTNEGPDTWSPYDVVGHLIHGEKTDWIPRMEIILSDRDDKTFQPFDRFAQFQDSQGKKLSQLLEEFAQLRKKNLDILTQKNLTDSDLQKKGMHPALGEVTLGQLLSTWVVHDLNHLAQISRVMAHQYKKEVGPWEAYLGILHTGKKN